MSGPTSQASPERPWLGLAHFTAADRAYFYGRDSEIAELTARVERAPLTILYGVSGYGKSSLIGAGLIPALRDKGHRVVLLRRCYDDLSIRPLQADVIEATCEVIPETRREHTETLWEFFHDRGQPWFRPRDEEAEEEDVVAWPVLLLDQFEEIFLKGEDRRTNDPASDQAAARHAREFLHQLADLVENRPPTQLTEALETARGAERRELIRRFDFQARPVRVAVAIRDDFLARLERLRREIPSMMEHRVELRLLSGPQAFEAVFQPGTKRPGKPPIIPEATAAAIVRSAAGVGEALPLEEIEAVPPILSLLCERLNDRRLAAHPPAETVEATDFAPGEAERILGRFYDEKLAAHPTAVRAYLEDQLVSESGFRENATLDSALGSLVTVPDAETRLRQLVDDRLLVIEDRGGIPRVEFTHDTLAKLALERRVERRAKERRRKALIWAGSAFAVAAVAIGLSVWAMIERAGAVQARTAALEAKTLADTARMAADAEKERAIDIIRFIEIQVGDSFQNVPTQLRERVSDRLDLFYRSQGAPITLDDHRLRLSHYLRKGKVHLAMIDRFEESDFNDAAKAHYIDREIEEPRGRSRLRRNWPKARRIKPTGSGSVPCWKPSSAYWKSRRKRRGGAKPRQQSTATGMSCRSWQQALQSLSTSFSLGWISLHRISWRRRSTKRKRNESTGGFHKSEVECCR